MVIRKYAPWKFTGSIRPKEQPAHVDLITTEHFNHLPDGTPLVCIDGTIEVKGVDEIDLDTRGGFIAYGFLCFKKHEGEENLGVYEKEEK